MPRYIGAYRGGVRPSAPTTVYRTCALSLPCHSEPVTDVTGVGIRSPFYASGGVLLPSAAKVPKNAVQTCGLKIPCAPSPAAYLDRICHANAVPSKFHLNVALSLLLFPLPLLLRNARLHNFTSQRESIYKNSGQRPPPTFAAPRQRRDLIIAQTPGGCFQRGRHAQTESRRKGR